MHFSRITPQDLRALLAQPDALGQAIGETLDLGIVWDAILGLLTLAPGSAARRVLTGVARPNFYRLDTIHCYTPARVRYGAGALGALHSDDLRQATWRLGSARTRRLLAMPRVRRCLAVLPALARDLGLPLQPQRMADMVGEPLFEHALQQLARLTSFWQAAATAGDALLGRPRPDAYQLSSGAGSPRRATSSRSNLR